MTEAEWLAAKCIDLDMREFVLPRLSNRKRRLFLCACCRRIWHLLTAEALQCGVEAAELQADGLLSKRNLKLTREQLDPLAKNSTRHFHALAVKWALDRHKQFPLCSSQYASEAVGFATVRSSTARGYSKAVHDEQAEQILLLRDIFGNPFRPVAIDLAWLTSDVLALARGIYDEKAFDRMPILADALQDAGCANEDVLNHCRDATATHVRGCWALDLILGKE